MIERFVGGYEERSWALSGIEWPDKTVDKGIDALVTRKSDGRTLAIEHTIVEPFVGEKSDYSQFERVFLHIERDSSLLVDERLIRVHVEVGVLDGQEKSVRQLIGEEVHEWIRKNRSQLPLGESRHVCRIARCPEKLDLAVSLSTEVHRIPGPGRLQVRRQQIKDDFSEVIAKTLSRKLPKLAAAVADKRLLLLERQHMNLLPSRMLTEIEAQGQNYRALDYVDEIWIAETMAWDSERILFFERYFNGHAICQFGFVDKDFFD